MPVVVFFQGLAQPEHARGVLAFQLDEVLGNHGDGGFDGGNAGLFQCGHDGVVTGGIGEHGPGTVAAADVVGAGFQGDLHQALFGDLILFDENLAFAVEHPGDRADFAEVAAVFREQVADLADGAVAVIGGNLHDDRGATGAVALEGDFVDLAAFQLTGAAHDGAFDVVGRHRDRLGGGNGGAESGVAVGVAAAAGGDGDLLDETGEGFTALGVEGGLLMLDCRPFRVS